jgi:hypothetical protein
MPTKREKPGQLITFSQTVSRNISKRVSVENTLILFGGSANNNFKVQQLTDSIVFSDTFISNKIISVSVSDTLTLGQGVFFTSAIYKTINDVLILTDTPNQNIKYGVASNTLSLAQTITSREPINVSASDDLLGPSAADFTIVDFTNLAALTAFLANIGLRQSVSINLTHAESATSFLSLSQSSGPTVQVTASNHIHLLDLVRDVEYEIITDILQLTHTAIINVTKPVKNILTLNQSVIGNLVANISLIDTLDLNNIVTFYRVNTNVNTICDYDPGVGEGPIPGPSMTDPVLIRRSTIILTYPYVSPIFTLELRNPQFDDTEQLEYRRINRKTRGNTLKVYRDNIWPSAERLIYSFDNLKEIDRTNLLRFMQDSIGQEIGLLDYESRQWQGILITPNSTIEREDRPGWDATIQFEGVQV